MDERFRQRSKIMRLRILFLLFFVLLRWNFEWPETLEILSTKKKPLLTERHKKKNVFKTGCKMFLCFSAYFLQITFRQVAVTRKNVYEFRAHKRARDRENKLSTVYKKKKWANNKTRWKMKVTNTTKINKIHEKLFKF